MEGICLSNTAKVSWTMCGCRPQPHPQPRLTSQDKCTWTPRPCATSPRLSVKKGFPKQLFQHTLFPWLTRVLAASKESGVSSHPLAPDLRSPCTQQPLSGPSMYLSFHRSCSFLPQRTGTSSPKADSPAM